MTPTERAEQRRANIRRIEAENHAAGRHRGMFVETCAACLAERKAHRAD